MKRIRMTVSFCGWLTSCAIMTSPTIGQSGRLTQLKQLVTSQCPIVAQSTGSGPATESQAMLWIQFTPDRSVTAVVTSSHQKKIYFRSIQPLWHEYLCPVRSRYWFWNVKPHAFHLLLIYTFTCTQKTNLESSWVQPIEFYELKLTFSPLITTFPFLNFFYLLPLLQML